VTELSRDRRGWFVTILRAPFTFRTWRELSYLLICLIVTTVAFALTISFSAVGLGLVITFIGLPLLAAVIYSRTDLGGAVFRWLSKIFLRSPVAAPPPRLARRPGVLGWLVSCFRDRAGWRGLAYILASFPIMISPYAAIVAWAACFTAARRTRRGGPSPIPHVDGLTRREAALRRPGSAASTSTTCGARCWSPPSAWSRCGSSRRG
jgi:hypothetical protein